MVDIPKFVRSKSQKLLGAIETVLNLPVHLDTVETGNGGSSLGSARAILRRTSRNADIDEYESKFTGEMINIDGRIEEDSLLQVLSCVQCSELCAPPLTQCRKGHLYCSDCRAANCRTCRLCKQAVASESTSSQDNIALDRLLSLISLECKYRSRGCNEIVVLSMKPKHETTCRYRPAQFRSRGCSEQLSSKDLKNHEKSSNLKSVETKPAPPAPKKKQRKTVRIDVDDEINVISTDHKTECSFDATNSDKISPDLPVRS